MYECDGQMNNNPKFSEWEAKIDKPERHEVYEGRMRYAGEARQMINSLRRNKYFQSKKKEGRGWAILIR